MKHKLKILITFIIAIALLALPLQASSTENNISESKETTNTYDLDTNDEPKALAWQGVEKNPNMEYCRHGIACEFDDESMTRITIML